MGIKYSDNETSGYNSSPPSDDGSTTEANKVKWSTIKTKLADPEKDRSDTMNSELIAHFDNGPTLVTIETTLGASHYNQVIEASGSSDVTLTDATSLGAGWYCDIINKGSNNFNLVRATASDTLDENSADIVIYPLDAIRVVVNAGATGFLTKGFLGNTQKWRKGADVVAANDTVLLGDGNYNDLTGATTINGFTTGSSGEIRKFHTDGAPTLKHNTAPSAGFSKLFFPSAADFVASAGNELEFAYDSVSDYWRATVSPVLPSDTAYASSWNGVTGIAPSKNAVYDKIESIGSGTRLFAIKGSDTARDTTTTIASDPDLSVTLVASKTYKFEAIVKVTADNGTPDFDFIWAESDGTWGFRFVSTRSDSTAVNFQSGLNESTGETAISTDVHTFYLHFRGIIQTAGSGGVFDLQWAQNISNGASTTVEAGSWMEAVQLD